ncbi:hypothetical protein HYC85_020522 [Camellia sinensis]|uniref:Uncharacterized protein n=1 Tax=Camellia sinensis TaxID=4442 RepID=A0A7J7GQA2_CAMSI|nr:hypothetical protein HYC85_020522 [Camellia sinensis]
MCALMNGLLISTSHKHGGWWISRAESSRAEGRIVHGSIITQTRGVNMGGRRLHLKKRHMRQTVEPSLLGRLHDLLIGIKLVARVALEEMSDQVGERKLSSQ